MSYKNLINNSLNRTFNLVKDLAEEVILTKRNTADFDFETGQLTSSTTTTLTIKSVVIDIKKPSSDRSTVSKQLLFKTIEVDDINQYSTVQIKTDVFNIGEIVRNDGFVSLINIYKES